MIKNLLIVSLLALTTAVSAQSADPVTKWGKALTTVKGTTQGGDLAVAADGGAYIVAGAGTYSTDEKVKFGDTEVAPGTLYTGTSTSGNQIFVLSKLSKDGAVEWTAYSKNGEVINNQLMLASVSDGVIVFFGIRHVDGRCNEDISIVDGKNVEHALNWTFETANAKRHYDGIVAKFANDGSLTWLRRIYVNHDPMPTATTYKDNTGQGIYPYAIVTDNEGNIYLGGNQRTAFTIGNTTIEANEVEGWDGDPQKTVGGLFLIKLDKDGNYLANIKTDGKATHERILNMRFVNNQLYFIGVMTGDGKGTSVSLDGKSTATLSNTYSSLMLGSVSKDLTANWFKFYPSTLSGSAINIANLLVNGDNLWITSKAKFTISDNNQTVEATKTRDAVLLKADARNGNLLAYKIYGTNQAGYFDAMVGDNDSLYVAGHTLLGPIFLESYDSNDISAAKNKINLATSSSDVKAIKMNNDGLMYVMFRSRGKTGFYNSDITVSPEKFSMFVSAYQMSFKDITTGISTISMKPSKVTSSRVYSISGQYVGESLDNLPAGLYIQGGRKVVVK